MTLILSRPMPNASPSFDEQHLPQNGWRLLGALLRASRWRMADERTGLETLSQKTGIKISTLSALETGKNQNPKVKIFQQLEQAGYVLDPITSRPYKSSELLAIACGQIQPLNPYTCKSFTYADFVYLKLVKSERELCQQWQLRSQLEPQRGASMINDGEGRTVLAQAIQRWMTAEGLSWEQFLTLVETAIESNNAGDDVTVAGISAVANGRLPTEAELNFVFLLPLYGSGNILVGVDGQVLDPVNDWLGTLSKLQLPLERYTSAADHRLLHGGGLDVSDV